jgi:hypothetical protein
VFVTALPPLKAPREDGAILAIPPLEQAGAVLARNRARLALLPEDWHEISLDARATFGAPSENGLLLLAGHQPELFHPGVWLKNFALAGLARKVHGTAINLVVDNDAVKSLSLAVPVPGDPVPRRLELAFAHADPETPWEECRIEDARAFEAFGAEVAERLRPWGYEPLIADFWPRVCHHAGEGRLGHAFAAARRELEREWGCHNVEVPMSRVCDSRAFHRFVGLLLRDPPRLLHDYNEAVRAYRRRHGLRSKNHPVPDLVIDGDWCELPLWAWRSNQRPVRRGRLFARRRADRVELRCGSEVYAVSEDIHEALLAAPFKVRSRALTTTLFARLCLGDVFLHGIGGGKYDELTDDIIRRVWGIEPPEFIVLTGTCLLPLPAPAASAEEVADEARRVRDLDWNPQRYLSAGGIDELLSQRQSLVGESPPTHAGRRERFRRLQEVNARLRPHVTRQRQEAEQDLRHARESLAVREMLRRRDYSFCLYPKEQLRAFCTRLL